MAEFQNVERPRSVGNIRHRQFDYRLFKYEREFNLERLPTCRAHLDLAGVFFGYVQSFLNSEDIES